MQGEQLDSYEIKAVFSVFIIVLIIFVGGMAQKMAATIKNEKQSYEYSMDDLFFENEMGFFLITESEENDETRSWTFDR